MKILIPLQLQNRYGQRKPSPEIDGEVDVRVAELLGLQSEKFHPHWLNDFDRQYSVVGVINRRVVAYSHFSFRELDLEGGNYSGHIACLASSRLSEKNMDTFFLGAIDKYTAIIRQLAAMQPAGIDQPLELPWIVLRSRQRRWMKTIQRHGWQTDQPEGDYMEDGLLGPGVTIHFEPPETTL